MNRREFMTFGSALLLTACASSGGVTQRSPANKGCCTNLADVKFSNYTMTEIASASIDGNSPRYNFSTGPSYFAGFKINGELEKAGVLEVLTRYNGFWLPSATLFVPQFAFLDASYNVLALIEPDLYQAQGKFGEENLILDSFYGACFVPPHTQFILINTNAEFVHSKTTTLYSSGSARTTAALEDISRLYLSIDKTDFAKGNVRHFHPDYAARFDLPRVETGSIKFKVTS